LLRKYLRGGIITNVQQPPHERVLRLSIDKRIPTDKHQEYHFGGDFGKQEAHAGRAPYAGEDEPDEELEGETEDVEAGIPVASVSLVLEVMGRLSNLVLVDDEGVIMDAVKRIPPSLNRYRTLLPHQPYVLPPAQEKRDPFRASPNVLSVAMSETAVDEPSAPAWKGLVGGLLGVSPTLAREAVYRSFGDTAISADDIAGRPRELEQVLSALRTLMADAAVSETPTTAWKLNSEGSRQPADFAPYRLRHLEAGGAEIVEHVSLSEGVEAFFQAASAEQLGGHSALKGQVRASLQEMLVREARRLRALREELARSRAAEMLKVKGEMILAYMHTLEPGQRILEIADEALKIELDPALTPVENAQAYFREYRKAQSAQQGLPERLTDAQATFDFWDGLLTSLDLAQSYEDIRAVQAEMQAARKSFATPLPQPESAPAKTKPKVRKGSQDKTPQPLRMRTHRGAHLLVGRTAGQNDTATFRLAASDDIWLHARGAPGSHVILRAAGGYTEEDVEEAARIAAGYSKLRNEQYVDVIVTERRNVRRVAGAPPGTATFKNERVLRVTPERTGELESRVRSAKQSGRAGD
jgi:predicted ribosome quality control (RQC) complex YloA/Tae2 family protein